VDCGGEVVLTIEVSSTNATSVRFAGPELDILVISLPAYSLLPNNFFSYPHSGAIFFARGTRPGRLPYTAFL
jgi:sugar lactone lactonase YvrE